jgi:hypothetical protein
MVIVAALPRTGGFGETANVAVGVALEESLMSLLGASIVTAPAVWSEEKIKPWLSVVIVFGVLDPTVTIHLSPAIGAVPSLVTLTAI